MKRLFLTFVFCLFASQASATLRYVAAGASGNCNAPTTPCSLATGLAATVAGDTLYLRSTGGNYGNLDLTSLTIHSGTSYNAGQVVTIANYPGEIATFVGSWNVVNFAPTNPDLKYVIFDGCTGITPGSGYGIVVDGSNNSGISAATSFGAGGANHIRVQCVEIKNQGLNGDQVGSGIEAHQDGSFLEFKYLSIHDNGPLLGLVPGEADYGIYFLAKDSIVTHSKIYNNGGHGIHMYSAHGPGLEPERNVMSYNEIYNNGSKLGQSSGGIQFGNGDSNVAYGNIIRQQQPGPVAKKEGYGIWFYQTTNASAYNNTIYGNTYAGIRFENGSGAIVRNNLLSNNLTAWNGTPPTHTNNFCALAETNCDNFGTINFQNAAGNDFHLTSNSPATVKDGGFNLTSTLPAFTTDFYGQPIPQGTGWPIGAAEFNLAPPANSIQSVTWTNSRTGGTGAAAGTTAWSVNSVPLLPGINPISVCATDTNGNSACDSLTITYAPTFPGNALVGAWAFDDGSGNNTVDSSGNGNAGGLINSPSWVTGIFPPSLLLNGTNQYVTVPNAASINFTQSFTYSAWVNLAAQASNYQPFFMRQIHDAIIIQGFYASITGDPLYCGAGGVLAYMRVNGDAGPAYWICDPNQLIPNRWTFLAMTYDNAAGALKYYRDGALVQSIPASGYIEPPMVGISGNSLGIGGDSVHGSYFNGAMDEARVANYALPLTTGSKNITPGAACDYSDVDVNGKLVLSIVSAMNCRIISPVPPLTFKLPAAATALQIGPGTTFKVGQP